MTSRTFLQVTQEYIRRRIINNKWIHLGGTLLSVLFCLIFIAENYQNIFSTLQNGQVNYNLILAAWLLTFIIVLLGAVTWWLVLRGFGGKLNFWTTINIHLQSSISKYIPGYAWQYLSKGILTNKQGIPVNIIGIAMFWEFLQIIWTGISISLITIPPELFGWINISTHWDLLCRIGGVILLPLPLLLIKIQPLKFINKKMTENQVDIKWLLASCGIVSLGWFALGSVLNIFAIAFGMTNQNILIYLTFTFTVSLIIGVGIVVVPNGLGICEGVMVYFLSKITSLPTAIVIAALSRLAITFNELLAMIITRFFRSNSME